MGNAACITHCTLHFYKEELDYPNDFALKQYVDLFHIINSINQSFQSCRNDSVLHHQGGAQPGHI